MDYELTIDRFTATARAYCDWIENDGAALPGAHFHAVSFLSRLYADAVLLPAVGEDYLPSELDVGAVDPAVLHKVQETLRAFPLQYYFEVFHALTEKPEEPVLGDLCDDLLDIYRDVRGGLLALDRNERVLAVWHWRSTFGIHWGRHATSALKALHEFSAD